MSLPDFESKAIEKGLDIAKAFLDKLIMPSAEELGVLIKEPISYWRLKNQIKILNKTKELCEKNDISLKQISLKLLCPLLELSSMEEDEDMQNLWVNLLTNYIDVNSKLNNVSFPEVLHRLSTDDIRLMNVIKERINKEFHLSPRNSSIDYDTQIQSVANLLHLGLIEDGLSFGKHIKDIETLFDHPSYASRYRESFRFTRFGELFYDACNNIKKEDK